MAPRLTRESESALAEEDRNELAETRTSLAEDRTILAHERSFAGWVRTGMASVGIGLGFNALFKALQPVWVPKAIATAFLLIAIFIFVSAERRACSIISRLEAHQIRTLRPMKMRLMTGALVAATLALGAAIWMLA
ncbi:YidH family protein [Novosphingobium panipatense]|uniref:YidH family protein n=1 Tax=Novosphingobium panipatense TaxID=428991 RepID=UPI003623FF4D